MRLPAHVTLSTWQPEQDHDRALHPEYLDFAADPATTLRETSPEQHLTASGFVLSPDLGQVLLTFHRKGQFWVQFGGHIEHGDTSLAAAALRECQEESGISDLAPLRAEPVDLDRHALSASFGTCQVHWDVGFAFAADPTAATVISQESEDLAWWPTGGLPEGAVAGLGERIARVLATVRAERGGVPG